LKYAITWIASWIAVSSSPTARSASASAAPTEAGASVSLRA
jgi:hypothetical protein